MAEKEIRTRSVRKPRHAWFDYEVMDVFGDELGMAGFAVYMVLSRFCFDNFRTTMGLRELASHARTSKDTVQRSIRRMTELGLVVERKGRTPKSPSTYYLVDVKDLAEEYLRTAADRHKGTRTVSVGDSRVVVSGVRDLGTLEQILLPQSRVDSGDAATDQLTLLDAIAQDAASAQRDTSCLTQRQMSETEPDSDPKPVFCGKTSAEEGSDASAAATHLSQNRLNLSQKDPEFETRLTRTKTRTKNTSPTPPQAEGLKTGPVEIAENPAAAEEPAASLPPLQVGGALETDWALVKTRLKQGLREVPLGVAKRFPEIRKGQDDYDAAFRDWWILGRRDERDRVVLVTHAADPDATQQGLEKYRARLEAEVKRVLRNLRGRKVVFELVKHPDRVDIAASAEHPSEPNSPGTLIDPKGSGT